MFLDDYRSFCLSLPGTSEDLPFDDKTLTFKVLDKIFALTNIENFQSVNLKCDPEYAVDLREKYNFVKPGYHMNKKHWNTVEISLIDDSLLRDLTMHSYEMVVKSMTMKKRKELE